VVLEETGGGERKAADGHVGHNSHCIAQLSSDVSEMRHEMRRDVSALRHEVNAVRHIAESVERCLVRLTASPKTFPTAL